MAQLFVTAVLFFALFTCAHWAETTDTQLQPQASGIDADIAVVTVETRELGSTPIGQSLPGVIQIGQDADFETFGRSVKVKVLVDYLEEMAQQDPNKLILFTDSDVFYVPSCPRNQILEGYRKVERETGAKIVFSAELSYYPLCNETCINVVPIYVLIRPQEKTHCWQKQKKSSVRTS